MHWTRRSRGPAVGAGRGAAAATCPGVGGSLGCSAALCSPHPRRRCLPNLAALAGGACTFSLGEMSLLQFSGSGFRALALQNDGGGARKHGGLRPFSVRFLNCESCQASRLPAQVRGARWCAPCVRGTVPSYLPLRASWTRGLDLVQSPHASGGPRGFRLCAEGEGTLSGPENPTLPWPVPLCKQLNRLGWPECGALVCPASAAHGPRDPGTQGKGREHSGAASLTRGGQGLPVRGCSILSCNSPHFLGASSWGFPILRLSWPLRPPSLRGPRSVRP